MTLNEKLIRMADVDIYDFDVKDAIDLDSAENDVDLISEGVSQGKNPYFLKYKGVVIKTRFSDTDVTIEDRMKSYIDSLN